MHFNCSLRQRALGQVRSAGCLGIVVTNSFGWVRHVSEVSSGSAGALGFLRRGLALAPRRVGAGQALVRRRLGCAAPVWHPCSEAEAGVEGVASSSGVDVVLGGLDNPYFEGMIK